MRAAIGLPPGVADAEGPHAQPHAELEQARERAGRRHGGDEALQYADLRGGLHDAHHAQNCRRRHEAVGVERHAQLMVAAEPQAEVADIAGLEAGIDIAAAVGHRDPAVPRRRELAESFFFGDRDFGIVGIAERIEMKLRAHRLEAVEHGAKIADHPCRVLVTDAHHQRDRGRDRFVAANAGRRRQHRRERVGGKAKHQENNRIPKRRDRPWQDDQQQCQQHDIQGTEAIR